MDACSNMKIIASKISQKFLSNQGDRSILAPVSILWLPFHLRASSKIPFVCHLYDYLIQGNSDMLKGNTMCARILQQACPIETLILPFAM